MHTYTDHLRITQIIHQGRRKIIDIRKQIIVVCNLQELEKEDWQAVIADTSI